MINKVPITLIKLGGSVITDKSAPGVLRLEVLKRLVGEISSSLKDQDLHLIISHGQGSFAHVPATKYCTIAGFQDPDSRLGMAITQDSAAQLNRIVVSEFIKASLPAVSFAASSVLVTAGSKSQTWSGEVLKEYLNQGLLPVTCGDVIVDSAQGCTIWSAEKILGRIVEQLSYDEKYEVVKIIHVTEVDGVLDKSGQVVSKISPANFTKVSKMITETTGFDVTGGMGHKIEEAMIVVKKGIDVAILSGLKKDNLLHALSGHNWLGTLMTSCE